MSLSSFTIEDLVMAKGVQTDDHHIVEHALHNFFTRVEGFGAGEVKAELSINGRETKQQKTTLEAWIDGIGHLVATSVEENVKDALHEVSDHMVVQINKANEKRHQHR